MSGATVALNRMMHTVLMERGFPGLNKGLPELTFPKTFKGRSLNLT